MGNQELVQNVELPKTRGPKREKREEGEVIFDKFQYDKFLELKGMYFSIKRYHKKKKGLSKA